MKRKDIVLICGIVLMLAAGVAGEYQRYMIMEMTFVSAIGVLMYRMFGDFEHERAH